MQYPAHVSVKCTSESLKFIGSIYLRQIYLLTSQPACLLPQEVAVLSAKTDPLSGYSASLQDVCFLSTDAMRI